MGNKNIGAVLLATTVFFLNLHTGHPIRCFECASRSGPGELNACLTGDGLGLRRVQCVGPSVCAKYYYEARMPGQPTIHHITRGCQALRYGATCEDIFHELRANGEILPGRHTCTTCSSDLCNSAGLSSAHLPYLYCLIALIAFLSS